MGDMLKKEFKEKLNIEKLKARCIYKNKFQLYFIIYFIGFFTNKEKYFFAYKNKKCIKTIQKKNEFCINRQLCEKNKSGKTNISSDKEKH